MSKFLTLPSQAQKFVPFPYILRIKFPPFSSTLLQKLGTFLTGTTLVWILLATTLHSPVPEAAAIWI